MMRAKEMSIEEFRKFADGRQMVFQEKVNGFRVKFENGVLMSEDGVVENYKFPHLVKALNRVNEMLPIVLDGEMYVEKTEGRKDGSVFDVTTKDNWNRAKYCVFDVLKFGDVDTRSFELKDRIMVLAKLVNSLGNGFTIPDEYPDFESGFNATFEQDKEGIVAKEIHSRYDDNENWREKKYSSKWIKVKHYKEDTLEIIAHEKGKGHGTFILKDKEVTGKTHRISGFSTKYAEMFEKRKSEGKRTFITFSYSNKTEENNYFQPNRLKEFVDENGIKIRIDL
jgi:ATP-dependent DNA ligase